MKLKLSITLIVVLSACNIFEAVRPTPMPDITQTLDAARTQAVQTAMAEITEQDTPTRSPESPPPTQPSSLTPQATLEPTQTATAIPPTPTYIPTATLEVKNPTITILAVERNRAVTLQANNFPKNQTFTIRVGPFHGFFRNHVGTGTLNSGSGGSFKFTVLLPVEVINVDRITVRLDSDQGYHAYNAFENVDRGNVTYDGVLVNIAMCQVSVSPEATHTFSPLEDFDAIWTVKNTSGRTWDVFAVDYKYIGGVKMHKYERLYDIPRTVESGRTINITVDMVAPARAGTYTTHWALVQSSTILCHLWLTVVVR